MIFYLWNNRYVIYHIFINFFFIIIVRIKNMLEISNEHSDFEDSSIDKDKI